MKMAATARTPQADSRMTRAVKTTKFVPKMLSMNPGVSLLVHVLRVDPIDHHDRESHDPENDGDPEELG